MLERCIWGLASLLGEARDGEDGQGLVEYGLILVLVSISAIAIMEPLGVSIKDLFAEITAVFP